MPTSIDWPSTYAQRTHRINGSEIRELLKLTEQPDLLSFAGGLPDPTLFPVEQIRAAYHDVLSDPVTAAQALQYSASEGFGPLREWIAGYMRTLGVECSAANILLTHGSQQALDFIGKLFLTPGDTALVTQPTYLGALQAFNAYEPRYDTVLAPGEARSALDYTAAAAATGQVKFAYTVPDFANPSGETINLADRQQLLELARTLNIAVIEDAAYTALRYEGEPVRTLQSLDIDRCGSIEKSRVLFCGTFSKTLTPALRLGWVCAATTIISKLVLLKQGADLHTSTINQAVMHRLASAHFEPQLERIRHAYRRRRDAMMWALEAHMPAGVSWSKPEGGMFAWVTLPSDIDATALLCRAVNEERLAYVPGQAFHADRSGANTLRLSYSLANEEQIDEGMRRLGRLIHRARAIAA